MDPTGVTARPFRHPPVIAYHSVEELGGDNRGGTVFKKQMDYLARRGYRTLSSGDFVTAVRCGEWAPKSVFITFDDGYLDFRTHAFPVLRAVGFSATVFLVSDVVDRGPEEWIGPRPTYKAPLMGWPEVRELRQQGVCFGSHGVTHRQLHQLTPAEFAEEATRSRQALEVGLGEEIAIFAYPYGECSASAQLAVQAAGYSAGLGLRPATPALFEIPRREVPPSQSILPFKLRVSSAYPVLSRLRHPVRRRS